MQGLSRKQRAGRTGDDLNVIVIFFDEAAHSQPKLLVAAVLQPSKVANSKQGLTSSCGALSKVLENLGSRGM